MSSILIAPCKGSHEITGQPRKTSLGELGKIIQATLEKRQGDTFSKGWEEVLVNGNAKGSPKGYFKATKSLRQGDTLSSFLVIIGAHVLSRILVKAKESYSRRVSSKE